MLGLDRMKNNYKKMSQAYFSKPVKRFFKGEILDKTLGSILSFNLLMFVHNKQGYSYVTWNRHLAHLLSKIDLFKTSVALLKSTARPLLICMFNTTYSYGYWLTYGYLISPMKTRSLWEGKTTFKIMLAS